MVNPFGESSSGSKYEWKAKFEQAQAHAQGLQSRVVELNGVIEEYKTALDQLVKAKEELEVDNGYLRQMLEERNESSADMQMVQQLEQKIHMLEQQLQNKSKDSTDTSISSLESTIVPLMLSFFNPDDTRFIDAYRIFIETIISSGSTDAKIIANLIKYGGTGPYDKLSSVVNAQDFDFQLNQLEAKSYLRKIGMTIKLNVNEETDDPQSSPLTWNDLSTEEIFDALKSKAANGSDDEVLDAFLAFRDLLDIRDIPITTILFSLRKTIEGIEKGTLSRKEIIAQVDTWKSKL